MQLQLAMLLVQLVAALLAKTTPADANAKEILALAGRAVTVADQIQHISVGAGTQSFYFPDHVNQAAGN